ncbi:VWA domain-containing protein [Sulfitobacter pseudonitzschiae]|uniref:VWA domain-containing protein n=1 Tax=Pseudosulfitobacter pseudonitzschiae TaxID=1402135 RepID=A0A9Q2NNG6_9RHOB|nr:VWA domain-containing protein [Pseudosulfitobacter pseudonitzschiae]MBM2291222.1 VWA domain-containing protein [Pseudosulfitobacter pseudonitzschiae]MBM2296140.1 VWA domain-containing protein [Pseudosulfitobacter pseudonitzschiae]MBM2301053.1 VWA domain-containing protein [Pseudosulfitobacter pseudonitzschiae]MBM2310837.1 VWA domain-containing protein [Pseudosulfitobacter pseudonitzschiae]MBM2315750.1 VWA domain-containing protein [Pseudosulfitobacter pseudonitzschiae]
MVEHVPLELPENPRLAGNITHFARALRRAGLPIGPGRVIDAIRAVEVAGFTERRDFYWTLHACFVNRPEHRVIFRQIFRLYWRDPRYLEHMMAAMLPAIRGVQEERAGQAGEKRAAEALLDGAEAPDFDPEQDEDDGETQIEVDASFTTSAQEKLKTLDFEQMSTAEMAAAKRMLARMRLPVEPMPTRRMQAALRGGVDPAKTLRAAMRTGGEVRDIARRAPRKRWPNLVVLCDISGSMSQYSRVVLHFLHAVSNAKGAGWAKVHAFTFGTRLTNITRHLDHRDVDAALAAAGAEAQDWEGGTRIGECIEAFNRDWSRRVLGQGAVVLLITDGLDRGAPEVLAKQMQRLHLSAKRLIWLNPLLRWDAFAPKARGIAAMLPHVDSFRAGHSIASLEELAEVISRKDDVGEKARLMGLIGK